VRAQYHRKNLRHVYDALTTLAASVHAALAEPSIVPLFVPQLLSKWQARTGSQGRFAPASSQTQCADSAG